MEKNKNIKSKQKDIRRKGRKKRSGKENKKK